MTCIVCNMKPSSDSKSSSIKSPAMRKLARMRSSKSATAASASDAAVSPSGSLEATSGHQMATSGHSMAASGHNGSEGAEAGPADSLREAGSSCFMLFMFVQGDPSCCFLGFVDIRTQVV